MAGLIVDENRWSVMLGQGLGDIELGTARAALLQQFQDAKLDYEADDEDPAHAYVSDMELQLTFSGVEPPVLVQIAVNDEQVRFGSERVIGRRLHEITSLLQVNDEETLWRLDDDPDESLPPAIETQ